MNIRPRKDTVVGLLLPKGQQGRRIWTPNEDQKVPTLMRVVAVGHAVHDVSVGDLVVLHPDWAGAVLKIYDDETEESIEYQIIQEAFLMLAWSESA